MEIHGSFTLRLVRDGKEILKHSQNNAITNNGLNWLAGKSYKTTENDVVPEVTNTGFIMEYCQVGEGRSATTMQEIKLELPYMTNTAEKSPVFSTAEDLQNRRLKAIAFKTFIFDIKDSKNLTEVGCLCKNRNAYTLLTRALITDTNGNPQAISVINGDMLLIEYQIEFYLPLTVTKSELVLKNPEGQDETFTVWDYWSSVHSTIDTFSRTSLASAYYTNSFSIINMKSSIIPTIENIDNALTNGAIQTAEQSKYISSILGSSKPLTGYYGVMSESGESRVRESTPSGFKHVVTLGPFTVNGEIRAINNVFRVGTMTRILYRNSDGGGYLKTRPDRMQYECGINITRD